MPDPRSRAKRARRLGRDGRVHLAGVRDATGPSATGASMHIMYASRQPDPRLADIVARHLGVPTERVLVQWSPGRQDFEAEACDERFVLVGPDDDGLREVVDDGNGGFALHVPAAARA